MHSIVPVPMLKLIPVSCTFYVSIAKATYCPPLPSRVITSLTGTIGGSNSPTAFVPTHHCIGRCSLLAHIQSCPGLPDMSDITISGMPCSRTQVRFHSLALRLSCPLSYTYTSLLAFDVPRTQYWWLARSYQTGFPPAMYPSPNWRTHPICSIFNAFIILYL